MAADVERAQAAEPNAKIFISYSRKDMAFADRLEAALRARSFEPLIDRTEIYAFEDWWKRLQALIAQADTVVFVLSPDAVASPEALREVEHAASLNKRLAPIVCRRVEYIFSNDAGDALAALQQGKAIMDRLTKLSPDNADWKADLTWFDKEIADLSNKRSPRR